MANLPASELLNFVIGDFRCGWDALASSPTATHRGNFMFALQAMVLLEVICRSCDDASLDRFAQALKQVDSRYFTKLPGRAPSPGFKLPQIGTDPTRRLLHTLFDVVRNGHAHQYQSTVVTLTDGQHLHVRVTGAASGFQLANLNLTDARTGEHLRVSRDHQGHVWLDVRTDVLFLDLVASSSGLGLPTRQFDGLSAPVDRGTYRYGADELVGALRDGGHSIQSLPDRHPVPTLIPQIYADALKSGKF